MSPLLAIRSAGSTEELREAYAAALADAEAEDEAWVGAARRAFLETRSRLETPPAAEAPPPTTFSSPGERRRRREERAKALGWGWGTWLAVLAFASAWFILHHILWGSLW